MNDDSSDARNTQQAAISFGLAHPAQRNVGRHLYVGLFSREPVSRRELIHGSVGHGRLNPAGKDRVRAHAERSVVHGDRAHQAQEPGLRRRVGGAVGSGDDCSTEDTNTIAPPPRSIREGSAARINEN